MGRNVIPKLGERRDGIKYEFVVTGSDDIPYPDNGKQIVYHRDDEVLAVCWADGFQECMASMWQSGYYKGEKVGYERAKREIRKALGVS